MNLFTLADPAGTLGLNLIFCKKTEIQEVIIVDTLAFGRVLIMGGEMQSAQKDEAIYHNALVKPLTEKKYKSVLILGGGSLACARDVLKTKTERVTMVDIDREIVKIAHTHLKEWHQGAMNDGRLTIVTDDAFTFIRKTPGKYDAIISDLPVELAEPSQFFADCYFKLNRGGVFCSHASEEKADWMFHEIEYHFDHVEEHVVYIPSFQGEWTFFHARRSK